MEIPVMVGAGLVVIGVGMGIGRIGGSAMEAIGRQPDAYGKIQTAMLIAAALVEGIGFAGGLPIRTKSGVLLGAIGVSGASADEDEQCAAAAIKAIEDIL